MTTLSEYKAMMEGALPAPYHVANYNGKIEIETPIGGYTICEFVPFIRNNNDDKLHAELFVASVNIAPSLIRVIELAEEALLYVRNTCKLCDNAPQDIFDKACDLSDNALSEIRKLRGE